MTAISRRQLLAMAAIFVSLPQRSVDMIVRSVRPEDKEMPIGGFIDFITPVDRFFVRSHVSVPKVDMREWRLKIGGHVAAPLTLTMEDLQKMPSTEVISVLECAGNGRAFFDPPVAGLQWTAGAAGNARWRGVRLADVLRRAGVKDGAVEVLFDGADVPLGTMADFQRSVPMKKALDSNTLLAYSMNDAMMPVSHGFPLRAVVPGWAGDSWAKWVTTIRVLNEEATGFWMKNAYLYPKSAVAPGAVVPADAMSSVTTLRVKSVIAFPENGARVATRKPIVVRGAAWSGDSGPISKVDVSVDGGRTWKSARLTGQSTRFGWRLWEFPWTPSNDGPLSVLARATDVSGAVQPSSAEWNPSGYLWNAIARVDLNVPASAATVAASSMPAPPVLTQSCTVCHQDDVIRQQRLTREQWERELAKMTNWGARIRPEDREALLDYLTKLR